MKNAQALLKIMVQSSLSEGKDATCRSLIIDRVRRATNPTAELNDEQVFILESSIDLLSLKSKSGENFSLEILPLVTWINSCH